MITNSHERGNINFRERLHSTHIVARCIVQIAQMQYEYDQAVDQMKEGRQGLEQYRALVERVTQQVANAVRAGEQPSGATSAAKTPGLASELEKLADLRERGILTDSEYQAAKTRLIEGR